MDKRIKQILYSLGADVCGIGSVERFDDAPCGFNPKDIYKDCKAVISFGVALPKGLFEVDSRLIYGHFNDELSQKVDSIGFWAARKIEDEFKAICVPMPSDSPYEFWDKESLTGKGLISMKHTAVVCGVGQLGKNTLLLNPTYGNRLILGAIFTNLELKSDPLCENICIPNCSKCISNCPVHAIEDGHIKQKLCRLNTYHQNDRGFETVDCNICRRICPVRNGK